LGKKLKETEALELFEVVIDGYLPGDLRASVRAVQFHNQVLTIASLSSYATRELKRYEPAIIRHMNSQLEWARVLKFRFLA
jgi:hypothetical protein